MKRIARFLGILAVALVPFTAMAQDHDHSGHDHDHDHGQGEMDPAAMMDMMTPGPHHAALTSHAGDWTIHSKMWMDPSAPPMEAEGTAQIKSVMNGLFITEDVQTSMMGMPWMGHGTFGFDKTKDKHVGIWYDTFGTMIMNFEGTCEDQCGKVTLTSDFFDPMTGETSKMKIVATHKDENHSMNEMYTVKDGKDVLVGVIEYTRKM